MPAIVTDPFKLQFASFLFNEANSSTDSHEYYIGIGKSDTYDSSDTVATPVRTLEEEREARNNLQSVKKVTGQSFVIPRYNWSSGSTYSAWQDNQTGVPSNSYYVMTEDNEVYICLQQGKSATGASNPSTVKPSYTDASVTETQAFETSDGYRWKLMYALSASRANTFLSSGFIPCQNINIDSASANAFELQQLNIQNTALHGAILGVEIEDGGTGYTSAPTITFKGNGSGASATATISGGAIVKIEMANESGGMGTGYDYASATVTGNAKLRPIIAPRAGIGNDARADLKSSSIMFNIKPSGDENDTFNITNDFRQILLLRNLDEMDSAVPGNRYTGNSSNAQRFLTITGTISASNFVVDEKITGGTSGVTAFIDELDSNSGNKIFFHQNSNTINGNFTDGETITGSGSGSGTVDSGNTHSIVDNHSGELLYIENRARVIRSSSQTEDIKVIITV
jgi:hypothetical protein